MSAKRYTQAGDVLYHHGYNEIGLVTDVGENIQRVATSMKRGFWAPRHGTLSEWVVKIGTLDTPRRPAKKRKTK